MFGWASAKLEKLSEAVAPPPEDPVGKFVYCIQRNDEEGAMDSLCQFHDPFHTVVQPTKGTLPLQLACAHGSDRLCRHLLTQHGANTAVQDMFGNTPLHHACMSSSPNAASIVRMLVTEFGASVVTKNGQNQTPYDTAVLDGVRQYLLPLQLQQETQHALDNGGVGLIPGMDMGGLRIANHGPPPPMGGGGGPPPPGQTAPTPPYPQHGQPPPFAPPAVVAPPVATPAPATPQAQAPSSMNQAPASGNANTTTTNGPPSAPSSGSRHGYARTGHSSAATLRTGGYRPDGFHSSSSDVSLQQKYGHTNNVYGTSGAGVGAAAAVPPPPTTSSAPPSGGGTPTAAAAPVSNPYAGAANTLRYGGATQRYPVYNTYTNSAAPIPVAPAPVSSGYGQYASGTSTPSSSQPPSSGNSSRMYSQPPAATNFHTFNPGAAAATMQSQQQQQPAVTTPAPTGPTPIATAATAAPATPAATFGMPPPPFSQQQSPVVAAPHTYENEQQQHPYQSPHQPAATTTTTTPVATSTTAAATATAQSFGMPPPPVQQHFTQQQPQQPTAAVATSPEPASMFATPSPKQMEQQPSPAQPTVVAQQEAVTSTTAESAKDVFGAPPPITTEPSTPAVAASPASAHDVFSSTAPAVAVAPDSTATSSPPTPVVQPTTAADTSTTDKVTELSAHDAFAVPPPVASATTEQPSVPEPSPVEQQQQAPAATAGTTTSSATATATNTNTNTTAESVFGSPLNVGVPTESSTAQTTFNAPAATTAQDMFSSPAPVVSPAPAPVAEQVTPAMPAPAPFSNNSVASAEELFAGPSPLASSGSVGFDATTTSNSSMPSASSNALLARESSTKTSSGAEALLFGAPAVEPTPAAVNSFSSATAPMENAAFSAPPVMSVPTPNKTVASENGTAEELFATSAPANNDNNNDTPPVVGQTEEPSGKKPSVEDADEEGSEEGMTEVSLGEENDDTGTTSHIANTAPDQTNGTAPTEGGPDKLFSAIGLPPPPFRSS